MEIESQNKETLENLSVELVVDEMGIPEGDLQFDEIRKTKYLEL